MKIVGSIEARMGSSRLPGKVMMPIFEDICLLDAVVRRFGECEELDGVIVATTENPKDDEIATWCRANGTAVFRGSEDDVLGRVVGAAKHASADAIVQMGADSAYLDFELIDHLVGIFRQDRFDFVCNTLELTYPLGIYGHIVRVSCLAAIDARGDLAGGDREDVTRFIWEHPDEFAIHNIAASAEFRFPELRLTVDYQEDLDLARELYRKFGRWNFTTRDIIAAYKASPEIFAATMNLTQESAPHLSPSGAAG